MQKHNIIRCAVLVVSLAAFCSAQAADIVVVGHPSAAALSKEQVADLYLGKTQSANVLDQPESAAIRAEFYKKATGKDLVQIKALWTRLAFTGKGQPPKEVADSAAVKKAVAADPKSVGYIEKSAVDASVKVLVGLD
jgi:ABC-type phosphate transport system substrate-binding protein